jgi:hypothetical protein
LPIGGKEDFALSEQNIFQTLYSIDVNEHLEMKGDFSYLSWAKALRLLLSVFPNASWEVIRFPSEHGVDLPFLKTEVGYFVEVAVTVEGIRRSHPHPVLDEWFAPIMKPTSFDINTSIQRALVKTIGLHGLGLYVYEGETSPNLPDHLGDSEESENNAEPIYELAEVDAVEGISGPYYMLKLLHGSDHLEVAVCNEVLEKFENLDIKLGQPCHVDMFDHGGKWVASDIRTAS